MGLYERLMGIEEPKIAIHGLFAVISEYRRSKITANQGGAILGLNPAERAELGTLIGRVDSGQLTAAEVHDVLIAGELRYAGYDAVASVKTRLGV